jgi:hypothetical protein
VRLSRTQVSDEKRIWLSVGLAGKHAGLRT